MKLNFAVFLLCVLLEQMSFGDVRPNIVFIMADDLGWRDTHVYGSTFYETPNIDQLAGQGMRFTDAYSASPLCSPTRSSIMSGQYPARTGFTAAAGHLEKVVLKPTISDQSSPIFKAVTPETITRLDTTYYTLAEALKDAGYSTAHFGKWHLGSGEYMAKNQGFDVTVGGGGYPGPKHYFSPYDMDTIPDGPVGEHIDRRMTREAIHFIQAHQDQPFFVNLWFYSVHVPLEAEPQLVAKYEQLSDPDNPQHNPVVGAMVETMDECVGALMDALESMGLDRNTLVVFTSDNGGLVEPWRTLGSPTSNYPLREGKGWTYDGGTRVPLIVRWPGRIQAGSVCSSPVSSVDFYPTLTKMGGAVPAATQVLDGIDLLPLLTGKAVNIERDLCCFFPHYLMVGDTYPKKPSAYLRQGDYKLIRFFADDPGGRDALELYNLQEDIGESKNLAREMPEKASVMNAAIDRLLEKTSAVVPVANPVYSPSVRLMHVNTAKANVYITYEQQNSPYVMVFAPVSLYRKSVEIKVRLNHPQSGKVFWSTKESPGLKKNFVEFSADDVDANGEIVVPLDGGGSNIKDVRIEVSGTGGEPFASLSVTHRKTEELLSVDFEEERE
ncbi:MAG: sulfatase [Kiritimatiellales bacterium]|nr:sulfatase [Kiritimatiellales bacterium]MCF7863765.1 sulfatase [Kiritimatiellales bacterium]